MFSWAESLLERRWGGWGSPHPSPSVEGEEQEEAPPGSPGDVWQEALARVAARGKDDLTHSYRQGKLPQAGAGRPAPQPHQGKCRVAGFPVGTLTLLRMLLTESGVSAGRIYKAKGVQLQACVCRRPQETIRVPRNHSHPPVTSSALAAAREQGGKDGRGWRRAGTQDTRCPRLLFREGPFEVCAADSGPGGPVR